MDRSREISSADYLDIDYDTISQALILTAFHSAAPSPSGWTLQFPKPPRSSSLEIGVLSPQQATEPESLSLGGFLTKLGTDSKPSTSPPPSTALHY